MSILRKYIIVPAITLIKFLLDLAGLFGICCAVSSNIFGTLPNICLILFGVGAVASLIERVTKFVLLVVQLIYSIPVVKRLIVRCQPVTQPIIGYLALQAKLAQLLVTRFILQLLVYFLRLSQFGAVFLAVIIIELDLPPGHSLERVYIQR